MTTTYFTKQAGVPSIDYIMIYDEIVKEVIVFKMTKSDIEIMFRSGNTQEALPLFNNMPILQYETHHGSKIVHKSPMDIDSFYYCYDSDKMIFLSNISERGILLQ